MGKASEDSKNRTGITAILLTAHFLNLKQCLTGERHSKDMLLLLSASLERLGTSSTTERTKPRSSNRLEDRKWRSSGMDVLASKVSKGSKQLDKIVTS